MLETIGDVGPNFSVQHLWQTQFAKIENKKIVTKKEYEKKKKIDFSTCIECLVILVVKLVNTTCSTLSLLGAAFVVC